MRESLSYVSLFARDREALGGFYRDAHALVGLEAHHARQAVLFDPEGDVVRLSHQLP